MNWQIHHRKATASTNLDARGGVPGDVFTADFQTAGRGRLDHVWHSSAGENLMMSAVISAAGLPPESAATLPLVAGLAVAYAVERFVAPRRAQVKWPNDVFLDGRKIAGILCERVDDRIIVGIGVNVGESSFPSAIVARATSLSREGVSASVMAVRDEVLRHLADLTVRWRSAGFAVVQAELAARDFLKGRQVLVRQTDHDDAPLGGLCDGICSDGALMVADTPVYAGEVQF